MTNDTQASTLAQLTADIVSAYVAHNQIAPSDLGSFIGAVAAQLRSLEAADEPAAEVAPEPAVPVRRSIQPDHLVCLACGKHQKLLKRHLAVEHGLTPEQYRQRFGLKPDYPMAAPNYRQQRRELALEIGLGQVRKRPRRRRKSTPAANGRSESSPVEARS